MPLGCTVPISEDQGQLLPPLNVALPLYLRLTQPTRMFRRGLPMTLYRSASDPLAFQIRLYLKF